MSTCHVANSSLWEVYEKEKEDEAVNSSPIHRAFLEFIGKNRNCLRKNENIDHTMNGSSSYPGQMYNVLCENDLISWKHSCEKLISKPKLCAVTVTWNDQARFAFECLPSECQNSPSELGIFYKSHVSECQENPELCKVHIRCERILDLDPLSYFLVFLSSIFFTFAIGYIIITLQRYHFYRTSTLSTHPTLSQGFLEQQQPRQDFEQDENQISQQSE